MTLFKGKYLVQSRYKCCKCEKYFLSGDILSQLPTVVADKFPVILTAKSGIDKEMRDSILDDVTTGKTFSQIGKVFQTKRQNR